eukprot:6709681-Prymnesium_polylepis.1
MDGLDAAATTSLVAATNRPQVRARCGCPSPGVTKSGGGGGRRRRGPAAAEREQRRNGDLVSALRTG